MRPTVIAYRLLQPVKERRTSTTSGFDLRSVTRAATLFTFCGRGDSPLARDEADGPRTTCSGRATPSSLFPVRALRTRYEPEPSTSMTPCDAAYRWPWLRGPRDRAKDSRALDVARIPLLSSPRAPIVIGALSARPGEPSRPNAATDRDPRASALPRRRTAA